jgi:hypothetical protein
MRTPQRPYNKNVGQETRKGTRQHEQVKSTVTRHPRGKLEFLTTSRSLYHHRCDCPGLFKSLGGQFVFDDTNRSSATLRNPFLGKLSFMLSLVMFGTFSDQPLPGIYRRYYRPFSLYI